MKIYESPRIISGTAEALRRSALFMIFNPRAPAEKGDTCDDNWQDLAGAVARLAVGVY